jgi:hypothetical protein
VLLLLSLHNFYILMMILFIGGVGKMVTLSTLYCTIANCSTCITSLCMGLIFALGSVSKLFGSFLIYILIYFVELHPFLMLFIIFSWGFVFLSVFLWKEELNERKTSKREEKELLEMTTDAEITTDNEEG